MIVTNVLSLGGLLISTIATVGIIFRTERVRIAAAVFLAVFAILYATIVLSHATLTIAEQTLLWLLPGIAAWDAAERKIPSTVVLPMFLIACIEHLLFYPHNLPLLALALVTVPLAVPRGLDKLAAGDRIVIAWLVFAVGLLGVLAAVVAIGTSMGRKNVPYVTHLAFATSILLLPYAYWGYHVGRILWRF